MRLDLFALYAGPDQIMTVTSGLASILGIMLIFWNKVVALFFKVVRVFRRTPEPATVEASDPASSETP
jgi:undecaprenyl pyrophosphate phosphatase UppP